jgi:heme-degrading monooxygenase HmoA
VPVALIQDFPDGTLDQYDRVVERMQLGGELPEGAIFHAAGEHEGGLRVVDVWESDEAFDAFAQSQIGPHTAAENMAEPKITRFPVHRTRDERESAGEITFLQVVRLPGLDTEAFDAADEQVVPGNVSPEGLVFHISGRDGDDFVVADVWTTKEARDAFLESNIRPVMEQTEFASPPSFADIDVHNTLQPRAGAEA